MSYPRLRDLTFVARLERYVPRDPPEGSTREGGDRAALAALRRGLGKAVGDAREMYPYVVPALGDVDERQEPAFYLIASLFALHPSIRPRDAGNSLNLGASLLQLARKIESEGNKRDGVERRFVALLNAAPHDLAEHLRHAVALLRSKQIPVDWAQLLRDVQDWNCLDHPVQREWARAFWAAFPTTVTDVDATTAPTRGDAQ